MFNFQEKDIEEGLDTIETPINIVAHKKIVCCLDNKINTGNFPQISKI